MTDVSGASSRGGPLAVLAGGLAVLAAAVVSLLVTGTDPASADTILRGSRDVLLVAPTGRTSTPVDGTRIPRGAVVRTGAQGAAELVTAGRQVLLAGRTSVAVLDGVRQRLDRGQLLIDVRRGPRLDLASQAGTVQTRPGAVVRVERGALLRMAVFTGRASLQAAGRSLVLQVPVLHQVQATYAGLPGRPTALALTDDSWEQRVALPLVTADLQLRALAQGLDGPLGRTVLTAAPAALRATTVAAVDPAGVGEQALRVALSQAGHRSGTVVEHLRTVQRDRTDGGSWGVVAALADAPVAEVSALLDGSLPLTAPVAGPGTGDALALLAGSAGSAGGTRPGSGAGPGAPVPAASAASAAARPGPAPGPQPGPSGSPLPVPIPVPLPVPVPPVPVPPIPLPPLPLPTGPLVQQVVDSVVGLLPAHLTPPAAPATPMPGLLAPARPLLPTGPGLSLP